MSNSLKFVVVCVLLVPLFSVLYACKTSHDLHQLEVRVHELEKRTDANESVTTDKMLREEMHKSILEELDHVR